MPEETSLPPRRKPAAARHAELDAAWGRFRRDILGLLQEGLRSPDVASALAPLVAEAADTLNRLARQARETADGSKRRVKVRDAKEARARRALSGMVAGGSSRAARLLEQMEAERARRQG